MKSPIALLSLILTVLLFFFNNLFSESAFIINNLDINNNLNSKFAGDWQVSTKKIDAMEYFVAWEKGIESVSDWKNYSVPGNLSSVYPIPFPKNFNVILKKEVFLPKTWNSSHFSLRLGEISDRDITYLNGIKIGSLGRFDDDSMQGERIIRIYDIPTHLLRKGENNLILIEVQNYHTFRMGILNDRVEIAPSSFLYKDFHNEENIKLFFISFYFILAGTFLLLYYHRRERISYLYFAFFIFSFIIYLLQQLEFIYHLNISYHFIEHFTYVFIPILFPLFAQFLYRYFNYNYNIIHKILDLGMILTRIISLFTNDIRFQYTMFEAVVVPMYLGYICLYFYWIIKRALEKNKDAIYMGYSIFLFIGSVIVDIFSTLGLISIPKLSGIFFFFFVISLAFILFVNIEKMKKYLESLNELLEKKVLIRTTDLNNSLSKLKELKNKEDKLYYILGINLQSSVTEIKDISSLLMKLDSIDNEERMSLVNIIHKRGEELFISLEDLIAWSKIQSGILLAQFEKISLKELTSHSIGILKESAIRKKIKLSFDISDELIFTDKRLLGFILRKIFSNAIRYTPERGFISVSSSKDDKYTYLTIEDSGKGMDEMKLNKVRTAIDYEPNLSDISVRSTGLGMVICNKYINLINGKFEITSYPNKGTKVNICLLNSIT
jgi:signal transduction histidine kinase